jgi:ATP/maltotriose-dependent transcriptional regulator MalT/DNA-binding XRE family transcriptional regulator
MAPSALEPTASFGSYLRFLRRRARLTQSELSIAVGYSPGQISMLENGQRKPDVTAVAALFIAALGLDQDRHAATQLVHLAEATALPISAPATASVQQPFQRHGTVTIQQQVIHHQEELGLLEEIPPLPTAYVPRPEPLQQLEAWLQHERRALVCGLAGMGKSTLAATLAHEYSRTHAVCWITLDPALAAAADRVLHQLALFVATVVRDAAPLVQLLSSAHGGAAGRTARPETRQLLFQVSNSLGSLQAPLLVFDDAHLLADNHATLSLLQRLFTLAPYCRMLFVGRTALAALPVPQLTLNGMSAHEAVRLVQQLQPEAHSGNRTTAAITQLHQLTQGNPLGLRLATNQWRSNAALLPAAVSTIMAQVVQQALQTLPPMAALLLDFIVLWHSALDLTAAGLGDLLCEEVADYQHPRAVELIQQQRLIEHVTYATPHPLIQEAVAQRLRGQPQRQRSLYRLAAQWAAQQGNLTEAAHYYCQAQDLTSACDLLFSQELLLQQSNRSAAAAVVAAAIQLATQPLREKPGENLGEKPGEKGQETTTELRRRLYLLHGDLLLNTLQAAAGQASYRTALQLTSERLPRAQLVERLATSLLQCGQAQDALDLCDEALQTLTLEISTDGIRLRLELSTLRVRALVALARFAEAQQHCQQAVEVARVLRVLRPNAADTIRVQALMALGYISRIQGNNDEAQRYLAQAVHHAQRGKLPALEAEAHTYYSAALRDVGDFAAAEESGMAGLRLARTLGNAYLEANALHYLSINDYYHHHQQRALERSEAAFARKHQMADGEGMVACAILQALVYAAQGEPAIAWQRGERARLEAQLFENSWLTGLALYVNGITAAFQLDHEVATARLQAALALDGFYNDRPSRESAQTFLGIVAVARGALAQAQQIAAEALAPGHGVEITLLRGLLDGMIALATGDRAHAITVTEQLKQKAHRTGYHVYAAEAGRLRALVDQPWELTKLPRLVCCGVA